MVAEVERGMPAPGSALGAGTAETESGGGVVGDFTRCHHGGVVDGEPAVRSSSSAEVAGAMSSVRLQRCARGRSRTPAHGFLVGTRATHGPMIPGHRSRFRPWRTKVAEISAAPADQGFGVAAFRLVDREG